MMNITLRRRVICLSAVVQRTFDVGLLLLLLLLLLDAAAQHARHLTLSLVEDRNDLWLSLKSAKREESK